MSNYYGNTFDVKIIHEFLDYTLALLKYDTSVEELKQTCIDSLMEFIGNGGLYQSLQCLTPE